MAPRIPSTPLYEEVRRVLRSLLGASNVAGVVLLDGDGGLLIHEGDAPAGDVEVVTARLAELCRGAAGLGAEPDHADGPSWIAADRRCVAWLAPAGRGLTLAAVLAPGANPSLAWRRGVEAVRELRGLIESLGRGIDEPAAEPDVPTVDEAAADPRPDPPARHDDDPIWE